MKLKRESSTTKVLDATLAKDAWWYENAKSIDVFIQKKEGGVVSCRIKRSKLDDWLKRTSK